MPAGGARPSSGRVRRCFASTSTTSSIAAARTRRPSSTTPIPIRPPGAVSTRRKREVPDDGYGIYREFALEAGDILIPKQRASIFAGTPLASHLALLGAQSLIVCGESTSGCVRARVVDGYSSGPHVTDVEECTYDRAQLAHKVNLFDMHHKYADVMPLDEVVAHLESLSLPRAAE